MDDTFETRERIASANGLSWDNTWVAKPQGFTSPVRIRRIITRNGQARFQYWGRALRWLPISADKAAQAIAEAVATGLTPRAGE